jgi:hypothetical protein
VLLKGARKRANDRIPEMSKQWAPASVLGCNPDLLGVGANALEEGGVPYKLGVVAGTSRDHSIHHHFIAVAVWAGTAPSSWRSESG